MNKVYIYKMTNTITGSVYIGKSNNVERRMREHKSIAFNSGNKDHDMMIHKKIREYGWDAFSVEVLEETDINNWEEAERKWISHYNSFRGVGYNEDYGGGGVPKGSRLAPYIYEIVALLKENKLTQRKIAERYEVAESVISNINKGFLLKLEGETYPLRQNGLSDITLLELKRLLEETYKSFREISEILGIGESTVKKINYGKIQHNHIFSDYPVRKFDSRYEPKLEAQRLRETTDLSEDEIRKYILSKF